MSRRVAIVAAFAASLAMPLLAGCGIRGPLYMPQRPAAPVPPSVPDPGLSQPGAPNASTGAATSAASKDSGNDAPASPSQPAPSR